MFFLWSLGTGAQQFARPQFAAQLGAPLFWISFIAASNSIAWLVTGPLTGHLSDRLGRKPLVIIGNALRGVTTVAQFFVADWPTFLVLEFIGGIGVSMWVTGASIIMADITSFENRGQAVAIRGLSAKVGAILGPLVGALIGSMMTLGWVFIFNGVTKVMIHLVVQYLVSETQPERSTNAASAKTAAPDDPEARRRRLRMLWPLGMVTMALSFIGFQGVLGAMFPSHVIGDVGLTSADVGQLMSVAATAATLSSLAIGPVLDRWGRKVPLLGGLVLTAAAVAAFGPANGALMLTLAVVFYGIGEGITIGTSDVYAMDVAPRTGRGTFLGNWSLIRNVGGVAGPLLLGALAQWAGGPAVAFAAIAAMLAASAVVMAVWGVESHPRTAAPAPADRRA